MSYEADAEIGRCAEIANKKRMQLEAYCDPGRVRDPTPREKYAFAIAVLWEVERDILGCEPKPYEPAKELTK